MLKVERWANTACGGRARSIENNRPRNRTQHHIVDARRKLGRSQRAIRRTLLHDLEQDFRRSL
jgi:hypothetical protein